jgi:hypothetical protein
MIKKIKTVNAISAFYGSYFQRSELLRDARLRNRPTRHEPAQSFEVLIGSDVSQYHLIGECGGELVTAPGEIFGDAPFGCIEKAELVAQILRLVPGLEGHSRSLAAARRRSYF